MQIIGTKNCSRCTLVKDKLKEKGVNFEYKDIKDLPKAEHDKLMKMASEKGIKSLPLIVMNNSELMSVQEVLKC